MSQNIINTNQEEWLKVLGKGIVTLPKKWRDEMGIEKGDIVKAKKEGGKVVIEVPNNKQVPYRTYTDAEIEKFLIQDKLPTQLTQKIKKDLSSKS